jgi:predicted transcriptional regulator
MVKISDVMSRDVFTLLASAPAEQAAWDLSARGFTGAPVRDERGRLVGMLSRSDLVDPERIQSRGGARQVQDLMTPALFTLPPGESISRAVRLMVREGIRRVVVMERSGEMVGIVTSSDILRHLASHLAWDDDIDTSLPMGSVGVPRAGSQFAPS